MEGLGKFILNHSFVQASKTREIVETLRTIDDIERLRDVWRHLQRTSDEGLDLDFLRLVVQTRSEVVRPHVMLLSTDGTPRALMVGRLEESSLAFKLGYKVMWKQKVRLLTIFDGGFMGDSWTETSTRFVQELWRALKAHEAHAVLFQNVRLDSALCAAIRTVPPFFFRDHAVEARPRWSMRLPTDIGGLYEKMGSKHRYWLRRLPKVLEKDHPGQIRIRVFAEPSEIELFCKDAEHVAKKTYQRGLGEGFIDNEENRKRLRLDAEKGNLYAVILYIADVACAFWIGYLGGRTCYLVATGYDFQYKKYELGTVLLLRMIQDLIAMDVAVVDFGYGDAFYKQRFGDQTWREAQMFIFAPTFKGLLLNSIRTLVFFCSSMALNFLKRLGVLQKIKTRWRARLRQQL
jgi:hypothetical protein